MGEDHDRIEELLAAYALRSLSGEDAVLADRLLSEHVPSCLRCRDAMAAFHGVAGELALGASPVAPPELLLPRIRRSMAGGAAKRRRGASVLAVAAGVVALVGMAGLSMSLGDRVSRVESRNGRLLSMMQALQDSGAKPVNLQSQGQPAQAMVELSRPDIRRLYLFGRDIPMPAEGRVYQLWLGSNGTFVRVQDGAFVPEEDGVVVQELTVDVSRFDEILITEEQMGQTPASPSTQGHVWQAFLASAA